ncbi:MAG TPA: hypothetical protein VMV40_08710 [Acidiferrobacter sp.]|nr:hypothetical protein [Acidiferrobacter sp.]
MKYLALILLAAALQGCSTYAGPFVTAISSDGNNGLNVQSCMVRMNKFTKAVSNAHCTSEHIQLRPRHRNNR